MPLQKLIGNLYSVILELLLWIIPIIAAVAGVLIPVMVLNNNGFIVLGLILGIITGILLDLIFFGPIIILMNIRSSLKNIEEK
jgi:hypothetical protein